MDFFGNVLAVLKGFISGTPQEPVTVSIPFSFSQTGVKGTMTILVQRKTKTADGIFGVLSLDWNPFTCVTCENLKDAIPAGLYSVEFTYSPAFNRIMPLIDVPGRTGIRIHWANFPSQLLGCIAVGTNVDGDSIDESLLPFNKLYSIISMKAGLQIDVRDIV
jgi:hypothetical protein